MPFALSSSEFLPTFVDSITNVTFSVKDKETILTIELYCDHWQDHQKRPR